MAAAAMAMEGNGRGGDLSHNRRLPTKMMGGAHGLLAGRWRIFLSLGAWASMGGHHHFDNLASYGCNIQNASRDFTGIAKR